MLIGHLSKDEIYLIDFGLAKKYRDSEMNHHPFAKTKAFVGTRRYVSVNAHMKIEQSRRDDLESLGYILIYLLKGRLPWSATRKKKRPKTEFIMETKKSVDLSKRCDGLVYSIQMSRKECILSRVNMIYFISVSISVKCAESGTSKYIFFILQVKHTLTGIYNMA